MKRGEVRRPPPTSYLLLYTLYPVPYTLPPVLHSPLLNVLRAFSPKSSEKGRPTGPETVRKCPRKGLFLRKNTPESNFILLIINKKKIF